MPDPILLQYGNYATTPIPVYYIEDDDDTSDTTKVPADAPVPSICMVNKTGDFHCIMKQIAGTWNRMSPASANTQDEA